MINKTLQPFLNDFFPTNFAKFVQFQNGIEFLFNTTSTKKEKKPKKKRYLAKTLRTTKTKHSNLNM